MHIWLTPYGYLRGGDGTHGYIVRLRVWSRPSTYLLFFLLLSHSPSHGDEQGFLCFHRKKNFLERETDQVELFVYKVWRLLLWQEPKLSISMIMIEKVCHRQRRSPSVEYLPRVGRSGIQRACFETAHEGMNSYKIQSFDYVCVKD